MFDQEAFKEAVTNAFVHNLWVDGNAPMITVYSDRIEILSRGKLPPKQTEEGFFLGESIPVNQKSSDVFLQLHISERSGRGVPKITEVYGKDAFEFRENSIVVTIPFDKFGQEESRLETQDNHQDSHQDNPQDDPQDKMRSDLQIRILEFCKIPRSRAEIARHFGYKDVRSFAENHMKDLLQDGVLQMTIPDKPTSKNQKYFSI